MNRSEATIYPAPPLPTGRPRLVVTGFMGTGKSTAGAVAAAALGLPFVDLDRAVERAAGRPIGEIFRRSGEAHFRRLERGLVLQAARLSGTVVATGGGAPLDADSFSELADGAVAAVLRAEPAEIARRLGGGDGRPLLDPDPPTRIRALLDARAEAYAAAGVPLDTTSMTAAEAGARLAAMYERDARPGRTEPLRLEVDTPRGSYPVLIGESVVSEWEAELDRVAPGCDRVAVVADESVDVALTDAVIRPLRHAGVAATRIPLVAGERAKSIDVVAGLWERFRAEGLDRASLVLAVGGGAIMDAAGFAAATFARGIGVVNVPTTLVGMVDAAIGGKVGIDHDGVKNLVGAFHHPRLVLVDPSLLASLPPPVMRQGLAEAVKALVLASPLALDVLIGGGPDERGLPPHLGWLIEEAVRVKAAYVSADPEDRSIRASLNLGHTFAHAVESASGFRVSHGDAVAIGLMAAANLGEATGVTPPGLAPRLGELLSGFGLPTRPPEALTADDVIAAMTADKKRRAGRPIFVVPAEGGCALLEGVEAATAAAILLEEEAPRSAPRTPVQTEATS